MKYLILSIGYLITMLVHKAQTNNEQKLIIEKKVAIKSQESNEPQESKGKIENRNNDNYSKTFLLMNDREVKLTEGEINLSNSLSDDNSKEKENLLPANKKEFIIPKNNH
ncbi:MAG: hypothetical protein AB1304_06260 [Bacteroidota bacterium]